MPSQVRKRTGSEQDHVVESTREDGWNLGMLQGKPHIDSVQNRDKEEDAERWSLCCLESEPDPEPSSHVLQTREWVLWEVDTRGPEFSLAENRHSGCVCIPLLSPSPVRTSEPGWDGYSSVSE